MLSVASTLGIGPKELAHLLGISERTILRGVQDGGIIDILLRDIVEGLEDPTGHHNVRVAAVMAARSGGLKTYLSGMRRAYVKLDQLVLRGPTPI